ncbi:RSP_7527 family protein [uncultured Litoreibacter sp.]|uniref:RSP_7527 family protein n=1 Tax=uncultured Litoreibacter sp. TaxID=1392394 RepID=UPI00261EF646|nr:hypothetical protein [uncultured Litoreibacter sp.]
MKIEETTAIDLVAIDLEARRLRAQYVAAFFASARTWVASKLSTPVLSNTKAA